jgi:GTP-binding protein
MKNDFTVLIVGRENVGKSSIFNKLISQNKAIVDDFPGVTRDRLYGEVDWFGKQFTVVDTGGILFDGADLIKSKVIDSIKEVIKEADLVVLVVDGKAGILPDDRKILSFIKENNSDFIVAVNKIDNNEMVGKTYDFYNLGIDIFFAMSAAHSTGLDDMLDYIADKVPGKDEVAGDTKLTQIAIIGKENVGKSSIFNALLNEERSIVTEIPGTTRDSVDSIIEMKGKKFIMIDTAGVKKRKRIKQLPEQFSIGRSFANVKRSDIVIHVVDAMDGIVEMDKKMLGYAAENMKAIILCINKWDLVEPGRREAMKEEFTVHVRENLKFLAYAPIIFTSAKELKGLEKLVDMVIHVDGQYNMRIKTGILNRMLREAVYRKSPVTKKGELKIYYMTQVSAAPPTFTLFVNKEDKIDISYMRYLEHQIRDTFGFDGSPIKLKIRQKDKKEAV